MKKIIFSDKFMLTKAVLEGRKTQRRSIVPQSLIDKYDEWYDNVCSIAMPSGSKIKTLRDWLLLRKHTRYCTGEVVAVAQSYKDCLAEKSYNRAYFLNGSAGWNNKMLVDADKMPHQICITDIRTERLQEISEKDAISEGITYAGLTYEDYGEPMFIIEGCKQTFGSARDAYAWLIDKINGKGTWQSNPYVFVYDFELVKW